MNEAQRQFLSQFGKLNFDISLKTLTTVRIGGFVDAVLYPDNVISLMEAINYCQKEKIHYTIFGNGSNILASDDPYDGLIIKLTRTLNQIYQNGHEFVVEAGVSLPSLAHHAMKDGYGGLEWSGGIPGTVGGAIYMNAGAYLSSMSEVVKEVLILRNGIIDWISHDDCQFSYRKSIFQRHTDWLIIAARILLEPKDPEEIKSVMNKRQQRRIETQPLNCHSFGSCFRNQTQPSWKYIDEVGLRGFQVGDVKVSEKHSNFVVNLNQATFDDMMTAIELIKEKVYQEFNVDLRLEVEIFNWNKATKPH